MSSFTDRLSRLTNGEKLALGAVAAGGAAAAAFALWPRGESTQAAALVAAVAAAGLSRLSLRDAAARLGGSDTSLASLRDFLDEGLELFLRAEAGGAVPPPAGLEQRGTDIACRLRQLCAGA